MTMNSKHDMATGEAAFEKLCESMASEEVDFNEADTRHRFLDVLIHDCLGWDRADTKCERQLDGEYSDYELGTPPEIVIEAKRAGITFEVPVESGRNLVRSAKSLCSASREFKAAFEQAVRYCKARAIQVGAVANSSQIIIFIGARTDAVLPENGKCLVFNNLKEMKDNFSRLWHALSPDAALRRIVIGDLASNLPSGVPPKLSRYIAGYPSFRYPSEFQQSLRMLSDLLIEDVPNTPEYRKRFLEECYCESGALAKELMLGKKIIAARYASLFNPAEKGPSLLPVSREDDDAYGLSKEAVAEALGRRPIVVIGDVGVGKTSFIRNLIYVKAAEEMQNGIFLYIDLGSKANLGQDIHTFLVQDIERQLLEDHSLDLYDDSFVRAVYMGDLVRFDRSIHGRLKETNPEKYLDKQIEMLEELCKNRIQHLQRSIEHLSKGRRKQIVICIDNADQRDLDDQQSAFLAAQEFAAEWKALVLVSIRPRTYFASKTAGSLSAYPQRILTISPPRVDLVLQRRLTFSLDLAEGKEPLERFAGISIKLDSIALFLRALLYSLKNNRELSELLTNITGGNIREVLELIKGFIGSPNVDSRKIIELHEKDGYVIPVHEFSKQALLGEYTHYDSKSSLAYNLFDIRYPEPREHFLSPFLLGYLLNESSSNNTEGFVQTTDLMQEMRTYGYVPDQIEHALRRLTNKKLIEATERVTFDEGLQGLVGDMPTAFRATTIGSYHLFRWSSVFAYIDAMVFDTPILDESVQKVVSVNHNSFDIKDRYKRSTAFRDYLTSVWQTIEVTPVYYDWMANLKIGNPTFEAVKRVIDRKQ